MIELMMSNLTILAAVVIFLALLVLSMVFLFLTGHRLSFSSPCDCIIMLSTAGYLDNDLVRQTDDGFTGFCNASLMHAVLPFAVGKTH